MINSAKSLYSVTIKEKRIEKIDFFIKKDS